MDHSEEITALPLLPSSPIGTYLPSSSSFTSNENPVTVKEGLQSGVSPNQTPIFPTNHRLPRIHSRTGEVINPSHRKVGLARIPVSSWSVPPPVPSVDGCPRVWRSKSSISHSDWPSPRWIKIACRDEWAALNKIAQSVRKEPHLRRSVENNIVQPDTDHIEESVVEYGCWARLNLE